MLVKNTATDNASYQNTFDTGISVEFIGSPCFKGAATRILSGTWFGESGNTPRGWESRALNNPTNVDFTVRSNAGETVPSSITSLPTSSTDAVLGFKPADTYISNQDVGDGFLVNQILLSGATLSLEGQSFQFGGILP